MKKFSSHVIGIASGEEVIFEHFNADGPMWAGEGPREVVYPILFSEPFTDVPVVTAGLSMWDIAADANSRVDLSVQTVSTRGCELRLRTWGDTRIARVRVSWQAIGPARDDELWDIE